jgi:heme/copper-type cytochrome/quinol oxidase subunit 3
MSMFQQLMAKPWEASGAALENLRHPDEAHRAAKRLALRVFLAVVAVLFMLLLIAYGGRMKTGVPRLNWGCCGRIRSC